MSMLTGVAELSPDGTGVPAGGVAPPEISAKLVEPRSLPPDEKLPISISPIAELKEVLLPSISGIASSRSPKSNSSSAVIEITPFEGSTTNKESKSSLVVSIKAPVLSPKKT